jgi:hydroxymethylpyrimidine pyrophosphatase-like HAD family hydrolase
MPRGSPDLGARLIATDLDGTLLRSDRTVSDRTTRALWRCLAAGIPTVLVTGRPRRWLVPVLEQTGRLGPVVAANGALVLDRSGAVLSVATIAPGLLADVVDRIRRALPDAVVAAERAGTGPLGEMVYQHGYPGRDLFGVERAATLADVVAEPALKLLVRVPRSGASAAPPGAVWDSAMPSAQLRDTVIAAVGEAVEPTFSDTSGLVEVSAAGVTKATGLGAVAELLGVRAEAIVAFGDMPNDLPMLAWAGTGVAVRNAHPEVLAAADAITTGNDDDGVACYLEERLAVQRPGTWRGA